MGTAKWAAAAMKVAGVDAKRVFLSARSERFSQGCAARPTLRSGPPRRLGARASNLACGQVVGVGLLSAGPTRRLRESSQGSSSNPLSIQRP
jgi:hypothetical protein